jgi:hypothetical protein
MGISAITVAILKGVMDLSGFMKKNKTRALKGSHNKSGKFVCSNLIIGLADNTVLVKGEG